MQRGTKSRLLSILALSILFAAGCSHKQDAQFFYTYFQSDPAKLDPFYSTDVISGRALTCMMSGLFSIAPDGSLTNDLAEKYTFDGTTLSATLRQNLRFSDGSPLTAEDIAFSFTRIRDSEHPTSPRRWVFASMKTIRALDRHHIIIELSSPWAALPYALTMPCCYIISKKAFETNGAITGSGPFKLKSFEHDEKLVFVKNEFYYKTHPSIEGIVFRVIPDDITARFEFLNGTIDYFELPYLAKFSPARGETVVRTADASVYYIALNNRRKPFTSRQFRRALNMAINRDALMKSLFKDRFSKASGAVPPGLGAYVPVKDGIAYNPSEARRIIHDEGLDGFECTLFIKADHQLAQPAEYIAHELAAAGLKVKVQQLEWAALKAATMKGEYDMAFFTWSGDYPEAENFLYPLFYSGNFGAGGNRSFYKNERVDELLLAARRTTADGKRFDLYREIERILIDDAPWIFLWYGDKQIALSRRVKNFTSYPVYHGMKGTDIILTGEQK